MNTQIKTILITSLCVVLAIMIGFLAFNHSNSKKDSVRYITGVWTPSSDSDNVSLTINDTVLDPTFSDSDIALSPSEGSTTNDSIVVTTKDYSDALRFSSVDLLSSLVPYKDKDFTGIQFTFDTSGAGNVSLVYKRNKSAFVIGTQYFDAPNHCIGIGTTKNNGLHSTVKMDETVWGKMTKAVVTIGGTNYILTPKRDVLEINCLIYNTIFIGFSAVKNIDLDVPINIIVNVSDYFDATTSNGSKVIRPLLMNCVGILSSTLINTDDVVNNWTYTLNGIE